jgi:hydrogenase maturation factor
MIHEGSGSQSEKGLPLGKLPAELLGKLLQVTPFDERVLVGPGVGLDCAVVNCGDRVLALKSDPITFAAEDIGWYAVQVNANDIATSGATPRWFLATVLLPAGQTTADLAERIHGQINAACQAIGVILVGGHTEITHGLDHPIVAGTLIGEGTLEKLVTPRGARPGDLLLLTKSVPIEATAILAREFANALQAHDPGLGAEQLHAACDYLYHPGISVLRDVQVALCAGRIHAMHDPTEGGLYTGAWELAVASGCSLWVDPGRVPVPPLAARLCKVMGIDPLGAIASGALLLAVPQPDARAICAALESEGIPCAQIGGVLERSAAPHVRQGPHAGAAPLPALERDEIARLYENH